MLSLFGKLVREVGQGIERFGMVLQGNYAFTEQLNRSRRLMPYGQHKPLVGQSVWVAPNATVIGQVKLSRNTAVWYGAVLRGDVNQILIGEQSSIGDNTVIHCSGHTMPGGASPTVVGSHVVVEPRSVLHGCVLKDGTKVGAGSIVFDRAVIESGSILGPGSFLPAGKTIPAGQLWQGSPAQFVRNLTEEEQNALVTESKEKLELARKHQVQHEKTSEQLAQERDARLYDKIGEPTPEY